MVNNQPTSLPQHTDPAPGSSIEATHRFRRANLRRYIPMLGVLLALSALGILAVFVSWYALPQPQQTASRAAANPNQTYVNFLPPNVSGNQTTNTTTSVVIKRSGGTNTISTAKLEFAFDATKISNLQATVLDWTPTKPPVILSPFTISGSGAQSKASITLGAPCDTQCYPLSSAVNPVLQLSFYVKQPTTISPTAESFITLTSVPTNTYTHTLSKPLKVKLLK